MNNYKFNINNNNILISYYIYLLSKNLNTYFSYEI